MAPKTKQEAQQPLILRAHRLMEAFAKSDDERDFYLDRVEGFIIYVDLDKSPEEIDALERELEAHPDRYCMIPKLTFYETKKIMEGFVNEKVYDIDTKEKLLDIIQSKEARSNFLEFIYDHHTELEKWQQYYQERSRIRIIEWLRQNHFHFVFEEDLEFSRNILEKLKQSLFQTSLQSDISSARKMLVTKAKTYYSNEALNPRPKRGRPPKQVAKQEIEPQLTTDVYLTVPNALRPFVFKPDISSAADVTFSVNFNSPELQAKKSSLIGDVDSMESIQQKLSALRTLSKKWVSIEKEKPAAAAKPSLSYAQRKKIEKEKQKPTPRFAKLRRTTTVANKAKGSKAKKAQAPVKKKGPVINLKKQGQTSSKGAQKKRIMPVQKITKPKPMLKKLSKKATKRKR